MHITYILSGLLGGFLIGLTGVGGGSLMTPLLVLGFGIPLETAIGTDLLFASLTKAQGVWTYHRKKLIRWDLVRHLLIGSLPMATLALIVGYQLPHGLLNAYLPNILAMALILTAVALLLPPPKTVTPSQPYYIKWAGAFIGLITSLSSVGAGAMGTALLWRLEPQLKFSEIVATELAHAVPFTFIAGVTQSFLGKVDFILLIQLVIGSWIGIHWGIKLNNHVPAHLAKPILAVLLILLSLGLLHHH
jgi:hypothetical protein